MNLQIPVSGEFKDELKTLFMQALVELTKELRVQQLPALMKLKDINEHTGISTGTLNKWHSNKGLPIAKIDGMRLVRGEALLKFIMEHED